MVTLDVRFTYYRLLSSVHTASGVAVVTAQAARQNSVAFCV
jgi:hypothetical protein